jgi:sucrose-phosphate synthase
MYRIAALKKGVFVSTSFLETFGLTFIEASASGLPFVATQEGGPVDIVKNCKSGELVDIADKKSIAKAIKKILTNPKIWDEFSSNGINNTRKVYTWENHCNTYIEKLKSLEFSRPDNMYSIEKGLRATGKRMSQIKSLLIVDIDDTLLGDENAVHMLSEYLKERKDSMGFGVATGRDIHSAQSVLKKNKLPYVDILISSVGSEIYYSDIDRFDKGWETHIRKDWKNEKIEQVLQSLPFIEKQTDPRAQRKYKISYTLKEGHPEKDSIPLIHNQLSKLKLSYNLIFSHGNLIDILPYRAGKGNAIRYLSNKWNIPSDQIITAGNSGNDASMLTGMRKGIVVGNYSPELERLRKNPNVYFATKHYAEGILEGLNHYELKSLKSS